MNNTHNEMFNILLIDDDDYYLNEIRDSLKEAFQLTLKNSRNHNSNLRLFQYNSNFNIYEIKKEILKKEDCFNIIFQEVVCNQIIFDIIITDIHLHLNKDQDFFNNKGSEIQEILNLFENKETCSKNKEIPLSLKLVFWFNAHFQMRNILTRIIVTSSYFDIFKKTIFIRLGADGIMERNYFNDKNNRQLLHDYIWAFLEEKKYLSSEIPVPTDYSKTRIAIEKYNKKYKDEIIAQTPETLGVYRTALKVAGSMNSDTPVIIYGESGVGKEALAKFIHFSGNRNDKLFMTVNCAAIPHELLESELFGHEKGSFTGAYKKKLGSFELTKGGTIFLDEIGELNISLQPKLLRVVQNKSFRRVGGEVDIDTDVSIISATNINIKEAISKKEFRNDLYSRLNVIELTLPPLRERKSEIKHLTKYFIEKHSNKPNLHIDLFVYTVFQIYNWPNNIRQLENTIKSIMVLHGEDEKITFDSIPKPILKDLLGINVLKLKDMYNQNNLTLKEVEKMHIEYLLGKNNNNINKTKLDLGISRTKLYSKLKEYGFKRKNE